METRSCVVVAMVATFALILASCGGGQSTDDGDGGGTAATSTRGGSTSTPTPSPTAEPPTPTPTSTPVPCDQVTVRITALDKRAEIVTLEGAGDLTGWQIRSELGGQVFLFPKGFVMTGVTVQVFSGRPQFGNTDTQLWWDAQSMWNNSDPDPAVLVCRGNEVQRFAG